MSHHDTTVKRLKIVYFAAMALYIVKRTHTLNFIQRDRGLFRYIYKETIPW